MARYNVGEIIRDARNRKSLSQEDLALGICSVGNLSKIENGTRQPTAYTFQLLMERLGEKVDVYPLYVNAREMQQFQLKHEIEKDIYFDRYQEAIYKLEKLRRLITEKDNLNLQFLWAMEVICGFRLGHIPDEAALEKLEQALRLTIPDFAPESELKCLLTDVEITIINNIAILKRRAEQLEEAIVLLQVLERQLYAMWREEKRQATSYPLIAFNLSNLLEDSQNYREASEVAARGAQYCIAEGVLYYFPYLLTNEGCNLLRLGNKEGENKLRQAYVIFQACRSDRNAEIIKKLTETEFHISLYEE